MVCISATVSGSRLLDTWLASLASVPSGPMTDRAAPMTRAIIAAMVSRASTLMLISRVSAVPRRSSAREVMSAPTVCCTVRRPSSTVFIASDQPTGSIRWSDTVAPLRAVDADALVLHGLVTGRRLEGRLSRSACSVGVANRSNVAMAACFWPSTSMNLL